MCPTKLRLWMLVLACTAGASACSSSRVASFTAEGEPAKVYLSDVYVGETPAEVEFPCEVEVDDRAYRVERDGCEPFEGTLRTHVSAGYIISAVETLGISMLFLCPNAIAPVEAHLICGKSTDKGSPAGESKSDEAVLYQLRAIKDLRKRGVLTEAEYTRERARLLGEIEE